MCVCFFFLITLNIQFHCFVVEFVIQRWVIEVNGAPGTLYSNETFQLQVDFPEHYPMEAPQVCANSSITVICIIFFGLLGWLFIYIRLVMVTCVWSEILWWDEQVIFVPPAPMHPHIYSNGHICLGKYKGSI